MRQEHKEASLTWLTFLTSTTTLLCCTIPILLITLGFGATLASVVSDLTWWGKISEYKFLIFITSGLLLLITFWVLRKAGQICPIDPLLAKKCQKIRKWNWRILWLSITIWVVGFISAYLLV